MTDELDDLNISMKAATPPADPARRAANLAEAQEIFARSQESSSEARPTVERGLLARLAKGVKQMQSTISRTGALGATTAVAAVAIFLAVPQGRNILMPPDDDVTVRNDFRSVDEREEGHGLVLGRERMTQALKKSEAPQPAPAFQAEFRALSDEAPMMMEEDAPATAATAMPRRQMAQGIVAPGDQFASR